MALPADIVARVARVLAQYAGLELPAWVVEARAAMRMARTQMAPADYCEWIASGRGAAELGELIELVRVGETRLFRHRSQIAAVEEQLVPALRGKPRVRVWSAGCAAGEEAYTLAIVLGRALAGSEISVVATDISESAIAVARDATYPASVLDHVPEEYRDAFVVEGGWARVADDIARTVRFERQNLMDAPPGRDFDVVWCRNVLIYFTVEARRRVLAKLVGATGEGGFVFVGYSESLREVAELDPVRAGDAVYYVRRQRRADTAPYQTISPRLLDLTPAPVMVGISAPRGSGPQPTSVPLVVPVPVPVPVPAPSNETLVALAGHPDPDEVAAELTARLRAPDLAALTIDLDGAELLDDQLAPVLRRVSSAARANGVSVRIVATRAGARRWLVRHQLDGDGSDA